MIKQTRSWKIVVDYWILTLNIYSIIYFGFNCFGFGDVCCIVRKAIQRVTIFLSVTHWYQGCPQPLQRPLLP